MKFADTSAAVAVRVRGSSRRPEADGSSPGAGPRARQRGNHGRRSLATSARPTRRRRRPCAATWPSSWRSARGRDPARCCGGRSCTASSCARGRRVGAQVRRDLDRARARRSGLDREAGATARGLSRRARPRSGPPRDALRHPSIASGSTPAGGRAERVLVLPLYPQYAASTTASTFDARRRWRRVRHLPELRFVKHYHDDPGYIGALAKRSGSTGRPTAAPKAGAELPRRAGAHAEARRSIPGECLKTGAAARRAAGAAPGRRSRHLPEPLRQGQVAGAVHRADAGRAGAAPASARVDVGGPGFTADCLETLEEIDQEARAASWRPAARSSGYVSCLNDQPRVARRAGQACGPAPAGLADRDDPADSAQAELARRRAPATPARARRQARRGQPGRRPPQHRGAAAPAPRPRSTSSTAERAAAGTPSSCLRRWTSRCATAPRPTARGSCRPPPVRSGSRSAASPPPAGRWRKQEQVEGALAHAVGTHRGEDQDARVELRLGIFSSLTHSPTSGRFSTSSITLPMYSDAISAHTSAAEVCEQLRPGWMP